MTSIKKADSSSLRVPVIDRRDLMKMGIGAGFTVAEMLRAPMASAQEGSRNSAPHPEGVETWCSAGWVNNSGRASGNGPMDATSQRLVKYVSSYSESHLTDSVIAIVNRTMVDSMASLISGFESEPARITARLARSQRGDLKCTVLGYGITSTPEMATFANTCMIRHTDFNDIPHNSDMIAGILAIGEGLHSTGPQVIAAIALAYEIDAALGKAGRGSGYAGWDGPYNSVSVALAAGKLMGLNEDQLANAVSLAIVPHMPMTVCHVGVQSMWKGCHSAEAARNGVWAAMLAREGMTGPPQPFEGRDGLFDHQGAFTSELTFPAPKEEMAIEAQHKAPQSGFKRFPSEGSNQALLELTPAIHAWTKPDEIESIIIELPFSGFQEIGDPPKFDPRNRETADHSLPYNAARAIIDGEIYVDSFTREKFMDPVARRLMAVTITKPNFSYTYQGQIRITVRKKSGEQMVKETAVHMGTPMTPEETIHKFNRICAFRKVTNGQRDHAYSLWSNLQKVKDIAEPMQSLAKFGEPRPLDDTENVEHES